MAIVTQTQATVTRWILFIVSRSVISDPTAGSLLCCTNFLRRMCKVRLERRRLIWHVRLSSAFEIKLFLKANLTSIFRTLCQKYLNGIESADSRMQLLGAVPVYLILRRRDCHTASFNFPTSSADSGRKRKVDNGDLTRKLTHSMRVRAKVHIHSRSSATEAEERKGMDRRSLRNPVDAVAQRLCRAPSMTPRWINRALAPRSRPAICYW